jgi:hypothetical protein
LQILQAFHVLRKQMESGSKTGGMNEVCSYMNCIRNPTRNGLYLTAAKLEVPNSKCFVCQKSTVQLALTLKNWTLQDFLEKIVKKDLGFAEPTLMIEGDCIWEEGQDADDSFAPNLTKLLSALPCGGIQHGTAVLIEDFSQDLTVEVAITNQEEWDVAEEETEEDLTHKFVIGGVKPQAGVAASSSKTEEDEDDDDAIEVVEQGVEIIDQPEPDNKRPAERQEDEPAAKKSKMNGKTENKNNVIIE